MADTAQPSIPQEIPNKKVPIVEEPEDRLKLVNRAGESRNPYVRSHAKDKIAWQLWTPETLELAKEHDRLIFLSIGYAACHWCNVLSRESFSHASIASLLNTAPFIPILVDRDSRPDLDRIYTHYLTATTGSPGWPLNVFLTPNLEPIFGGTYWPGPASTTAHPDHVSFANVLLRMRAIWTEQSARARVAGGLIRGELRDWAGEGLREDGVAHGPLHSSSSSPRAAGLHENMSARDSEAAAPAVQAIEDLDIELLDEAVDWLKRNCDSQYGGFGHFSSPKYPTPSFVRFCLSLSQYPQEVIDIIDQTDLGVAKMIAFAQLNSMWYGGIKDQIGNGFHRSSVVNDWSIPLFEKTLFDNAQLLNAYTDAYVLSKSPTYLSAIIDIITYLLTGPLSPTNEVPAFLSSEDSDSIAQPIDKEPREGAYYVWTSDEITDALGGDVNKIRMVCRYWGITNIGNVPSQFDNQDDLMNQNVLAVRSSIESLATEFSISKEKVIEIIQDAKTQLKSKRDQRAKPGVDTKVVTSWNALTIGALARTGTILNTLEIEQDLAKKVIDTAVKTANFIKKELLVPDTRVLMRNWSQSVNDVEAFAEDYAHLISALIDLYESTWDDQWLEWADELQKTQIDRFWDNKAGGFFSTAPQQADVILRLKDCMDAAEPSANGTSTRNLHRLGSLLNEPEYIERARKTLHAFDAEISQVPHLFVVMLDSVVSERLGLKSVVICGRGAVADRAVREVREGLGVGRTVVRLGAGVEDAWLRSRNELLRNMDPEVECVQECVHGACRLVG